MFSIPTIPPASFNSRSRVAGSSPDRISPPFAGIVIALVLLAKEPLLICCRRLLMPPRESAAQRAARLLSLPSLRAAVLGHSKQYLSRLFGPPVTLVDGACAVWYYPLQVSNQLVMAISFSNDRAVLVEFFHSPSN